MPPITVRTVPEPTFKCIHPHSVRTGRAAKRALSAPNPASETGRAAKRAPSAPSPASGKRALDSSTRANTQHASGCRAGTGGQATSKTSCRLSEKCRGDRENRRPAIPVNGKMWRGRKLSARALPIKPRASLRLRYRRIHHIHVYMCASGTGSSSLATNT